jgi:acyl-CoA hydrolase
MQNAFHVNSLLYRNVRHTIAAGNGSYTPVFLSELPFIPKKILKLDYTFIHVSPPDSLLILFLGASVEVAMIQNSKIVIAQVNP